MLRVVQSLSCQNGEGMLHQQLICLLAEEIMRPVNSKINKKRTDT